MITSLTIVLAIVAKAVYGLGDAEVESVMPSIVRERCTTVVVGPKAGIYGAMNTQNVDCLDCDFRLAKVPARDWPEGSMRPLLMARSGYPAYISSVRGPTWDPDNIEGTPSQIAAWGRASNVTGYIPQVAHTFSLLEAQYGIVNEKQVSMGETTCPCRFWATPTFAGGKARIEIGELTKVALERASTAREAIRIMGELAVKYGFYGSDWSGGDNAKGDSGEALTVIDKTEAWVFHVTADDTATSAVWVAKRVPSDHIAVVSDQFVIRDVDPDSDDFMFSDNLWEVAARNKLYSYASGKKLNFLKTYGVARYHSSYATRRVWRIFSIAAPSIQLPAYTNMWADDYPFSVPVDKKLSPEDLMQIMRDHYEGSEFDLTQGLASGPYGEPNRWDVAMVDNMTWYDMLQGAYERSTSIFRTSNSFVANARTSVPDSMALLWFAQYAPSSASYTPIYVNIDTAPPAYTKGSLFKYDNTVSFWNFCAAGNYAARFYKYAMADIKELQATLFATALAAVTETETTALTLTDPQALIDLLTATTHEQAANVVNAWRDILPQLITKYHDGYMALDLDQPNIYMKSFFYPKYWLDATGYWLNKPNLGPGVILFDANPIADASGTSLFHIIIVTAMVSSLSTLLLGAYYLRRNGKRQFENKDYATINL